MASSADAADHRLPPLRELLEAHADDLADAVLDRFGGGEDGVGGPTPDAATLRNLRIGARAAVDCFLARLAGQDAAADLELFVAHGRAQQAAGRTLTELLSFYRRGGIAMWERSTALLPAEAALPAGELFAFGAAVLELVDELSVAAAGGFTAREAEERRRSRARRERLLSLLLSDPPMAVDALRDAAAAAGWALPQRVRVAVGALPAEPPSLAGAPVIVPAAGAAADTGHRLSGSPAERDAGAASDAGARPLGAPPDRVLTGAIADARQVLVVAADDEDERWLVRAANALGLEAPLALGPAVPTAEAARSAARAAALLDHVEAGGLDRPGDVVRADDHELALLLGAAPELAREVARRRLAPLAQLDAAARERMTETLAAWLADPGRPQAMADRLGLHVQTVRYRLRGLRDLFGDALDDPDERFELALALRVQRPDHAGGGAP